MEKRISGTTALYCLIGTPIGHSGSPAMYNYSFQKLGIDSAYVAFDISIEKVKDTIAAFRTLNIKGANVTMPCKNEVAKYMDELSPAARLVGAVNTIVNDGGKLTGNITDGVGFVRNLKEHGVDIKNKKITILGAGGAATAIQVQCALDGAKEINTFNIKDDFYKKAEKTIENIRKEVSECVLNLYDLEDVKKLNEKIADSDILVNATHVGMHPNENESPIKDIRVFRRDLVVSDVIYNPRKTKLLEEAEAAGCKIVTGIGMLLWQGVEAFKLYTGLEMPAKEVDELFFK
ncbi:MULTISPECIES: shikimate dehydrogenase [Clostridium]|uniref:Shikimate dehydrogenase (NADP(+)) n=1 Tax=Clostridium saccharoperbutylacetonicum N1-4(HMT) TaxID=931276 RepID=M1N6K3_9CLOT|nr:MULTISPECIES: shikimate dehydrogenase [Clostridium]AGF59037.1 shikimate dehydrogenase AroE [Clostridium saccharoperbutylacetonicum N1-4(HMT)]AQR97706.1 shikimate dehydrogenase [Clostridium saccharoperbutylacetonicum]NRT60175.1 shikimate dehydrogenase [Clostridium saccharoperbutylacetonicum]NSB23487.1 shikimate dehydrogenase [Clostridium saccharoperbutylacetonicum]NSB33594.1 shikimate dehydrogenase [Clostridium saccharoperbutylacetonicum]